MKTALVDYKKQLTASPSPLRGGKNLRAVSNRLF